MGIRRSISVLFPPPTRIFLVALVLLNAPLASVEGAAFRPICRATGTIVLLQRDSETNLVSVVDDSNNRNRRLGEQVIVVSITTTTTSLRGGGGGDVYFQDPDWLLEPTITVSSRLLQQVNNTFYMRECFCSKKAPVYCPLNVDFCGEFRGSQYDNFPLGCLSERTSVEEFAATTWLVIFIWFFIVVMCVFCSFPGRNCLSFFIASCIPCWNKFHVNRMMERQPDMAQYLIRRSLHIRRMALERRLRSIAPELAATADENQLALEMQHVHQPGGGANGSRENKQLPTSLILKTRIYHSEHQKNQDATGLKEEHDNLVHDIQDEEDLETNCIICFQTLEDGCCVGNLQCDHVFHVDCLRSWLQRRNVCPLCQRPEAATPRFDEQIGETGDQEGAVTAEMESDSGAATVPEVIHTSETTQVDPSAGIR